MVQTDRYFIDRKKVITDLFVRKEREICTCVYKIVNLLKNHMTVLKCSVLHCPLTFLIYTESDLADTAFSSDSNNSSLIVLIV